MIYIDNWIKESHPHKAPFSHDTQKPFICVNCGETIRNDVYGQKVVIKFPILCPNIFELMLDIVDPIYVTATVCFKGEISLP